MNSNDLARRILARLGTDNSELPALEIQGQRIGLSVLAAMPSEARARWGENVQRTIENFLGAVQLGRNSFTSYASDVIALPENGWVVMQFAAIPGGTEVSAIMKGNKYPLLYTGMDLELL